MKIEIKSWLNGSVLFEGDFSCLADAVSAAVKSGANLSGANLSRAHWNDYTYWPAGFEAPEGGSDD